MTRLVVVGATRNFFKVGHTTFRHLAATRPDIDLRLGILDTTDARRAVQDLDIELVEWDPAQPETLPPVLENCDSMLMVPPIDNRIAVADLYIDAARQAGVNYILCLGIQHGLGDCQMGYEVNQVTLMLQASGIHHDVISLPVFLENLLYQIPSIASRSEFVYPVGPDKPFSYTVCADLGEVFSKLLVDPPDEPLENHVWTSATQITCDQWAEYLSEAVGRPVLFRQQSGEDFVRGLQSKDMSKNAAIAVLELWKKVDDGLDVKPSNALERLLGHPATTAQQWTSDHACCFAAYLDGTTCRHPTPPRDHMF